jgi:hypothetical protein
MNVEGQAAMMIQETLHDAIQGIHPDTLHFRVDRNPHIVGVVITGSTPYHQGALIIAAHHVAALGHIAVHSLPLLTITETTTDCVKSLSLHTKIKYSSAWCCLTMMATILNCSYSLAFLKNSQVYHLYQGWCVVLFLMSCVTFGAHCWVLMKSIGSHGSSSLLFTMKVMV